MKISRFKGARAVRFSKNSASGQAAIEFILLGIVIVIALICVTVVELGSDSPASGTEKGSVEFEQTRTGTVKGKYIDSDSSGKHYYVTVENNGYEADHEVSLAEYDAAQVGADFPIPLTDSNSVKSDEAQEQADNAQADATKSQAAESQRQRFNWWWIMNNQMLMNMRNHSD